MNKFWMVLLLSILLLACNQFADLTTEATPTVTNIPIGNISGKVIDSNDGTYISTASVSTEPPTSSVTTDGEGSFSIPDIPVGSYTVTATKSGYTSVSVKVAVLADKTTTTDLHLISGNGDNVPATSQNGLASDDGLLFYLPLNGDTNDESGNGNNGTMFGGGWVAGKEGQALELNGRNDYVQVDGNYEFSDTNQITIMAWFKLTNHADFDGIISSYSCCAYRIMASPKLHPYYDAGTHNDVEVSSFTFEPNEWYHYALTIDDGLAKIIINGEKIFESSKGVPERLPDIRDAFLIGSGEKGIHYVSGIIDEVFVYNRALTETEVQQYYQGN